MLIKPKVKHTKRHLSFSSMGLKDMAPPEPQSSLNMENNQKKLEWIAPQILEMSTALTDGKSYGGIEASPLEPPGPS